MRGLSQAGSQVQDWHHLGCPSPLPPRVWQQSVLASLEAAQELVMGKGTGVKGAELPLPCLDPWDGHTCASCVPLTMK